MSSRFDAAFVSFAHRVLSRQQRAPRATDAISCGRPPHSPLPDQLTRLYNWVSLRLIRISEKGTKLMQAGSKRHVLDNGNAQPDSKCGCQNPSSD